MEGAGGDEEDMVGLHHAVTGTHIGALHQRQKIALYPFPGDIRALLSAGAHRHLVDFVDEDDAAGLYPFQCQGANFLFIDQLGGFIVRQQTLRFAHGDASCAGLPWRHVGEHLAELVGHLLHARRGHDLHPALGGAHLDLDFLRIQLAFAQHFAELLASALVAARYAAVARTGNEDVENPLLGQFLGALAQRDLPFAADHVDGGFGQIADDGFHILAHIAHLGEFGGFHFDEGGIGELRQTPGDFRLAHSRRPDHEDIFGGDFLMQRRRHLPAPPAVAQGDGHCALGLGLADDVLVQLLDDLAGGHFRHAHSSSIVCWWLV